jgi:hypothetical protein
MAVSARPDVPNARPFSLISGRRRDLPAFIARRLQALALVLVVVAFAETGCTSSDGLSGTASNGSLATATQPPAQAEVIASSDTSASTLTAPSTAFSTQTAPTTPPPLGSDRPYRMRAYSVGQDMTKDPGDSAFFSSPSGNISCAITPESDGLNAVCELKDRSFPPDPRPASCPYPYPWAEQFVAITSTGASSGACVGDVLVPPVSNTLPYGQNVTDGSYTCSSAEAGVTCTDTTTGNGFEVSRAHFTPFTSAGPSTR